MSRRFEAWLGLAILGAIGVIFVALSLVGGGGQEDPDDAIASTSPTGRRALWLALAELGFDPQRWDLSPSELPRGHDVVWLGRVPSEQMPGGTGSKERMERLGLHALDHYREFVERGGTLILHAGPEATRFLSDDLGFEDCRALTLEDAPGVSRGDACTVRTGADEDLRIGLRTASLFAPLDPNGAAREMWSMTCASATRPFVVEVPEGAGTVVLLAQDEFVRNRSIGEHDNAVAAVRLVEQVLGNGRLLLDEYETGTWSPPSMLALMVSPRLLLLSLHLAACVGIFVWMQAFARAFPRDREALELFSPVVRARALGGVLARAHRWPALAVLLRRGVFARLDRRLSGRRAVPRSDPGAEKESQGGLRRVTSEEVAAFAKAAGLTHRLEELELAFVTLPVRTRDDLDALDRVLDRIRREIEDHLGARTVDADDVRDDAVTGAGAAAVPDPSDEKANP
jgi:hypothetical protein